MKKTIFLISFLVAGLFLGISYSVKAQDSVFDRALRVLTFQIQELTGSFQDINDQIKITGQIDSNDPILGSGGQIVSPVRFSGSSIIPSRSGDSICNADNRCNMFATTLDATTFVIGGAVSGNLAVNNGTITSSGDLFVNGGDINLGTGSATTTLTVAAGPTLGINSGVSFGSVAINADVTTDIASNSAGNLIITSSEGTVDPVILVGYGGFAGGPTLNFAHTRSAGTDANTIVQNGDNLGDFAWWGADGANYRNAASIIAAVDGTPGVSDMPGRLTFSTTADGAAGVTERMRITSAGRLGIASTSPWGLFSVESDNSSVGTNNPIFVVGDQGTSTPFLYVSGKDGNVGIGTTTPSQVVSLTGSIYLTGGINPAGGNTGIGTASAEASFEVQGSGAGNYFAVQDKNGTTNYFVVANNGNVTVPNSNMTVGNGSALPSGLTVYPRSASEPAIAVRGVASQSDDIIRIQDSGGNNFLLVSSGGNIGIGTTSPSHILSVSGGDAIINSAATTTLRIRSTSGTQVGCIELADPTTPANTYRVFIKNAAITAELGSCE